MTEESCFVKVDECNPPHSLVDVLTDLIDRFLSGSRSEVRDGHHHKWLHGEDWLERHLRGMPTDISIDTRHAVMPPTVSPIGWVGSSS